MRPHRIVSLIVMACCVAFSPALTRAADTPSTRSSSSTGAGEGGGPGSPVIAVFKLNGPVLESPTQDLFSLGEPQVQLRDLVRRMRLAADDDNVKALVLLD